MRWGLFLVLLAGCLDSHEVRCGDLICAEGRVCAQREYLGETKDYCATQAQVDACKPFDEGDGCEYGDVTGTCRTGLCIESVCGNGVLDDGELCDDGNTSDSDAMGVVDGCSASCMSSQTCGNHVIDTVTGETCDNGPDGVEHDGCSSGCRIETPRFEALNSVNAGSFFGLAYDSDRHRPVMFGGFSTTNTDLQARIHGHWQKVPSPNTPQSREAAMTFDRDHHELVMYGTTMQDAGLRDTWTRDANGWHLRDFLPTDHVPDVTPYGIVFDAAHHRVVMVGGAGGVAGGAFETWEWNGSAWKQIALSAQISPRDFPAVGYDEQRGVIVIFGGNTDILDIDELWELDGETWTQRPKQGNWPEQRFLGLLSYDPNKHTMVLVGGSTNGPVWDWDGTTWTPSGGPATSGAMITDLDRKRVVVVASELDVPSQVNQLIVRERRADGTWAIEGDVIPSDTPAAPPDLRASPAAASNPRAGEVVVFGGNRADGINGETFVWRGSWRKIVPSTPPPAREGASMVYDPIRDEMVMFGGCKDCANGGYVTSDLSGGNTPTWFNDTWTFRAGQWTKHTPPTSPEARALGAMAWDNVRGRVILIGGVHTASQQSVDAMAKTWSWDGSTWVAESPQTVPSPKSGAAIAYDPLSNNVVMFGGALFNSLFFPQHVGTDETWVWDGTNWERKTTSLPPPPRAQAAFAWNVARQKLQLFGGDSVFGLMRNDLWEWNGSAWAQVAIVSAPPTTGHAMVALPDGSGVAVIGGGSRPQSFDYSTVRTLRWDSDDAREEACVDTDFDGDGLVGCADPDCWYDCNVECPLATTCDVGPRCGDTLCNDVSSVGAGRATEDCASCPLDCGACS